MIKKPTRTLSLRRHGFRSFKERVDALKIEPLLNLAKRALDYVEVSHFLTTLTHWQESNLSGNFVEFLDAVEPLAQSLPQLLYHKKAIWQKLAHHIANGDKHSLQPLLELLTQFIHDLGPDFLEFYSELLPLLIDIASRAPEISGSIGKGAGTAAGRIDAALLEWVFNCMAYMFKYLQRSLVADLKPTILALVGLLLVESTKRKALLARFAAEALSFLIRKQKPDQLDATIAFCFENELTVSATTSLFSESIKLVQQGFHSKGMVILAKVAATNHTQVVSNIVADLMSHGNETTVIPVVLTALKHPSLLVVAVLAFAELGKKTTQWNEILEAFLPMTIDKKDIATAALVATLVFRNADSVTLTKSHRKLWNHAHSNGYFAEMVVAGLAMPRAREQLIQFGIAKEVASKAEPTQEWALLKWKLRENLEFALPSVEINTKSPEFWQLVVSSGKVLSPVDVTKNLIESKEYNGLALVVEAVEDVKTAKKVVELVSATQFTPAVVNALAKTVKIAELSDTIKSVLVERSIDALGSTVHELREAAIELLVLLEVELNVIPLIRVAELVPLTVDSARDVKLRIRQIVLELLITQLLKQDEEMIQNWLVGQLSNKFKPLWEAVFEALPKLGLSWKLATRYLIEEANDNVEADQEEVDEEDVVMEDAEDFTDDLCTDTRFTTAYDACATAVAPFSNIPDALREASKESQASPLVDLMRTQILKALVAAPKQLGNHGPELVDYITSRANWHNGDRELALTVLLKQANLHKYPNSDGLRQLALNLLGNMVVKTQKLAFSVLSQFGDLGILRKYADRFTGLLEDDIFRDQVTNLQFAEGDADSAMPYVVRVLFGRVQGGGNKSKGTKGQIQRNTVLQYLPNLSQRWLAEFFEVAAEATRFDDDRVDSSYLHRLSGYIQLLNQVFTTVRTPAVTASLVPLTEVMITAQAASDTEDEHILKITRNLRLQGYRALTKLMAVVEVDWAPHIQVMYRVVEERLPRFALESRQQVSGLMEMLASTTTAELPLALQLLYHNDFAGAEALLSVLPEEGAKPEVVQRVLQFCADVFALKATDEQYYELVARTVTALAANLPAVIDRLEDIELAVQVLLTVINKGYLEGHGQENDLLLALTNSLSKKVTGDVLKAMVLLLGDGVSHETYETIYRAVLKLLLTVLELSLRHDVVTLMLALPFPMALVVAELNAFERTREYDFNKRLAAFKRINEVEYRLVTAFDWLALVYLALFFIQDEDLPIYSNAQLMLNRFIEVAVDDEDKSKLFEEVFLPTIKMGLRGSNDIYVELLASVVLLKKYPYFDTLTQLDGFENEDGEDIGFFSNICHIQLHQRRTAMLTVALVASKLEGLVVFEYLMPILERYAMESDEKYVHVLLDALHALPDVLATAMWSQWRQTVKRYTKRIKREMVVVGDDGEVAVLKKYVRLLQMAARSFPKLASKPESEALLKFITGDYVPLILPLLQKRNDHTIEARLNLALALGVVIDALGLNELIASTIPQVILPTCNLMRLHTSDLRDEARKVLIRMIDELGPAYLLYIFKQLKSSLSRGSQIHVLAYTVHYLLTLVRLVNPGELDDSIDVIMAVAMEDIFGAAGQEKDAEGYVLKIKEVRAKKSFDTVEIISGNISLEKFASVINPLALLLREQLNHKTQVKLDQVVERVLAGVMKNVEAGTQKMLQLCYDVLDMAQEPLREAAQADARKATAKVINPRSGNREHFLVNLDRRQRLRHWDSTAFTLFFYQFGLEMLRSVVNKYPELQTTGNMAQFVPILVDCIGEKASEQVAVAAFKGLVLIFKHHLAGANADLAVNCTNRCLDIIRDLPLTEDPLCQSALKMITAVLKHCPEVVVSGPSVGQILIKCQLDLEDPKPQSLVGFAFIKAVLFRHVEIPEVYELVDDCIAKIMVVNHHSGIREQARQIYFQFLMEYDQLKGRLDKQFKFLVANLEYPTEEGRQSVMELLNHIIISTATLDDLLAKLSLALFISLCQVAVADDLAKGRQMALVVVEKLLKRNVPTDDIKRYIQLWMESSQDMLKRCGLTTYKIWHRSVGSLKLDATAVNVIGEILADQEDKSWELVYLALTVVQYWCSLEKEGVFSLLPSQFWNEQLSNCLLYPHPWVRLVAAKISGVLLGHNIGEVEPLVVQTMVYRLLRQVATTLLAEDLSTQAVKNLVKVAMHWQQTGAPFIKDPELSLEYPLAMAMLIHRTCGLLRQDPFNGELLASKQAAMKLAAMLIQIIPVEEMEAPAEAIILALNPFIEEEEGEAHNLAVEVQQVLEGKFGVTEFTRIHAAAHSKITKRRFDRRLKRAELATTAPEATAKRKLKKNERAREKRRHEKDDNGYYHTKKKKRI